MAKVRKTLIYNRVWHIHPKFKNIAIAENGDVCDMRFAPAKMLSLLDGGEKRGIYVSFKSNGKDTTMCVANQMVYLFGLKPWEEGAYYRMKYKDGNYRNIHISNLEVYKRRSDLKILSKAEEKEIGSLLKENKLSRREIAEMYSCTEMTVRRLAMRYLKEKPKKIKVEYKKKPEDKKISNLLREFDYTRKLSKAPADKLFTMVKVNDALSNYKVYGVVNGVSMRKIAHGSSARIQEQVKRLNKHFFGC